MSNNDRRVSMFNSMMQNRLTPEQTVVGCAGAAANADSLSDRMARIVAVSKISKSFTDKNQMPPKFEEATKHMSDTDKANMLVMMNNIANDHSQIQTNTDEYGGQEILLPLSLFKGMN